MKWVTFYHDVMSDKIYDFVEHKDKVSATEYFKKHYKDYFQLQTEIKVKLPMTYGLPFLGQYIGMTLCSFKKRYGDVEVIG
jgi:hypothetical protein